MPSMLSIRDIETAIRIYYNHFEIGNTEMERLFVGVKGDTPSRSSLNKLKNQALELMAKRNVKRHGAYKVNTEIAYEAWGINIKNLEYRRNKLIKLGLASSQAESEVKS